ncbi:MAG: flavodoxin [Chloroflexota bacterium]
MDDISNLKEFDYLILGCPTWNVGELQDDWELELPNLENVDFSGKRVALFGAGDQAHYSDNFQDALGILGRKLRERGATLVGFTSTEGYDYDESVGVENDMFMGLAIDEVNQSDLTGERIEAWVKQLVREFELTPA